MLGMSSEEKGKLGLLGAAFVLAVNTILIAVVHWDLWALSGVRALFALPVLLVTLLLSEGEKKKIKIDDLLQWQAAIAYVIHSVSFVGGVLLGSPVSVAIAVFAFPIWTDLLSAREFRCVWEMLTGRTRTTRGRPWDRWHTLLLVGVVCGEVLLFISDGWNKVPGNVLGLISGFVFGVFICYLKMMENRDTGGLQSVIKGNMIVTGIGFFVIFFYLFTGRSDLLSYNQGISGAGGMSIVILVGLLSGLAFAAIPHFVKSVPAVPAQWHLAMELVFTGALYYLWTGVRPSWKTCVAGAIVFAFVVKSTRWKEKGKGRSRTVVSRKDATNPRSVVGGNGRNGK